MVSFHVEPTSKCTLACSLCDRTWFYEKFKTRSIHEIDVDNLVSFVGANANIELCGNNGDPIYHSKFLELIRKLKDNNCRISIITNGSSRSKTWWTSLSVLLTEKDSITFSIDGLEDTNHIYRKNSKWHTIIEAVNVMSSSKCKLIWKFIVFKHNQHQIEQAQGFSKTLGFDHFRLEQSDRWLGQKDLMPDEEYVDKYYKHQESVLIDKDYQTQMSPACLVNDKPSSDLYIDAEGDFYPCCWMGTYRYKYKNIFSPKQSNFNIRNNTLQDILQRSDVVEFFNSTKQFTSAHDCCKIQCGVKNG